MRKLVLGGGCFWGVEELIRALPGVDNTEVGYAGGENDNPTYEFHPGHAEVVQITYNETKISLQKLLDFFFTIHDPTTKNRQGNDVGESYRSVIFYQSETEKQIMQDMIEVVNDSQKWKNPVTTQLEPLTEFFPAEDEHQDYLQNTPGGYTCHYQRFDSYIS